MENICKRISVSSPLSEKMKMNYLQSQKIERIKCESNMIFLGFAIYKVNYNGYKSNNMCI